MRTEIHALMPDDVEAIRRASTLVFVADSEGRAKVRATLEKNDPADFTKAEARIFRNPDDLSYRPERVREFRVDGYANFHGGTESPFHGKRFVGVDVNICARYNPTLRSIGKLLRPGYGLELLFSADLSTNNNHRKADFHADDFHVRIWTPILDREGWEPQYELLVNSHVGPHDSARLVRAEGDVSQASVTLNIDHYFPEAVPA